MSVINLKKLRLLEMYQQEDPNRVYESTISKVKPFGVFFEVPPLSLEGFIHVSELHNDYYEYHPTTQRLIGKHSGSSYIMGDKIEVQLEAIDLILVESKWQMLQKRKRKRKRKRTKK